MASEVDHIIQSCDLLDEKIAELVDCVDKLRSKEQLRIKSKGAGLAAEILQIAASIESTAPLQSQLDKKLALKIHETLKRAEYLAEDYQERYTARGFFKFDVALSYSRQDAEFVRSLAFALSHHVGRKKIFFDEWHTSDLIGADLDSKLTDIYSHRSRVIVPIFSQHYPDGWSAREWGAIRALLLDDTRKKRVLPFRLDSKPIPGWNDIDWAHETTEDESLVESNVDLIMSRIEQL